MRISKLVPVLLIVVLVSPSGTASDDAPAVVESIGTTGGASVLATALSRADVDAIQSSVSVNTMKGGFGESYMDRYFTRMLRTSSDWQPIRSRIGPQGIDGLYVKYDRLGGVDDIMVAEAKYGSSRLAMTKDGIQMGNRWTSRRLARMGKQYSSLGHAVKSNSMAVQKVRSPSAQLLQIPMNDGKAAVFWRANRADVWKFAGPAHRLLDAGDAASKIGAKLVRASEQPSSYSKFVYRIRLQPNGLDILVKNAMQIDTIGSESRLPVNERLRVPLTAPERLAVARMTKNEIKSLLSKKFPNLQKASVERYADSISRSPQRLNDLFAGKTKGVAATIGKNSAMSGGIASILAIGIHTGASWYDGTPIDWVETGEIGVLVLGGTVSGAAVGQGALFIATRNPTLQMLAANASRQLSFASATTLTRGVSGLLGGGVGVVVISSGGYLLGFCDADQALRGGLAGFAGVGAGIVFSSSTLGLVAAFGTASTGTAISSLGGAAATNAALAWLGGGSLAAGGGGVAAGGVVLTGGVVIVVVAATAVVMKGFQLYDTRQDNLRIQLTISSLKEKFGRRLPERSN